jgi:hypothetical protein
VPLRSNKQGVMSRLARIFSGAGERVLMGCSAIDETKRRTTPDVLNSHGCYVARIPTGDKIRSPTEAAVNLNLSHRLPCCIRLLSRCIRLVPGRGGRYLRSRCAALCGLCSNLGRFRGTSRSASCLQCEDCNYHVRDERQRAHDSQRDGSVGGYLIGVHLATALRGIA